MSDYLMGFIGCGNMGSALAGAASKKISSKEILLANRTPEKAKALAAELGALYANNTAIAAKCKYIVLGVKPQQLYGILGELAPIINARSARGEEFYVVSMAAGVSTYGIANALGNDRVPIIRIMPNTPCLISSGLILLTSNEPAKAYGVTEFKYIMDEAGRIEEIDEKQIDAASAISGCGPAFVYMFIDALADGGVMAGLTKAQAVNYAAQTLLGAGLMVLESGKSATDLKDDVCSPGGSTICGVKALEDGSFRADCMNAIAAAYEKTKALGK